MGRQYFCPRDFIVCLASVVTQILNAYIENVALERQVSPVSADCGQHLGEMNYLQEVFLS